MAGFRPKAILLDFYGTVVEEDDLYVLPLINAEIAKASPLAVTPQEVGRYWWQEFGQLCLDSYGDNFQLQRDIEQFSLQKVLEHFKANLDSEAISQTLFDYWAHPTIFPESKSVLAECALPICVVSNIDNAELSSALKVNDLHVNHIVTREDCRAYKPRGEMFVRALSLLGLEADEVLHVGDSFSSDVRGAQALAIRVLWLNRKQRNVPADQPPDYVASDLTGLLKFV
jgi:2-haloacid dehalogenase/putative hydrolase of the HAD superfamily